MSKSSVVYECSSCGAQSPKWAGQCGECGKWNTLSETVVSDKISNHKFSNSQIKFEVIREKLLAKGRVKKEKGYNLVRSMVRHDSDKLAKVLVDLVL